MQNSDLNQRESQKGRNKIGEGVEHTLRLEKLKIAIKSLLQETKVSKILQCHVQLVTLNPNLPAFVAFRALAEYRRTFALVCHDVQSPLSHVLEPPSFIKWLIRKELDLANLTVAQFADEFACKTPVFIDRDTPASEALELLMDKSAEIIFVTCSKRKVPVGYITDACICAFICKHLSGEYPALDIPISELINDDTPRVSPGSPFSEALEVLSDAPYISLSQDDGKIFSVISRDKLVHYALNSLKNQESIRYSTPISEVANWSDIDVPTFSRAKADAPLKSVVAELLLSSEKVLVVENESDSTEKLLDVKAVLEYLKWAD